MFQARLVVVNMKHPMSRILQVPEDGYTKEEEQLLPVWGDLTLTRIYGRLPTNRMKAIVALHFECGYTQEQVASVFGISQGRISQEIERIKDILKGGEGRDYKGNRISNPLNVEDLISFLVNPD